MRGIGLLQIRAPRHTRRATTTQRLVYLSSGQEWSHPEDSEPADEATEATQERRSW